MADGKYMRLSCAGFSLTVVKKRGGARPGAGRKRTRPLIFGPPKPKRPKGYGKDWCDHPKPRFASGKERKVCFDCKPKPPRTERAKYMLKAASGRFCSFCGSEFLPRSHHAKFCESKCRVAYGNRRREELAKDDPVIAASIFARKVVRNAFARRGKPKSRRTAEILGCTFDEFRAHIERQFLFGMSWANRSDWHIDHIIPLASALTVEDVARLNHFTNLRPMWAHDNRAKGAKLCSLL